MRRLTAAVAALAGLLGLGVAAAAPAAAVQTSQFGMEAADGDRLEVTVEPGRTSRVALRVWNRTEGTLTLGLDVFPATVAADGTASLAGDREPAGWVVLPARQVRLAAGETRLVEVEVRGPDTLGGGDRAAAVVAQVLSAPGSQAAVVERLARVMHMTTVAGEAPSPGLGPIPWIAALLAGSAAAAAAKAKRDQAERNQSTVARSPSASGTGSTSPNSERSLV